MGTMKSEQRSDPQEGSDPWVDARPASCLSQKGQAEFG